MTRTGGCINRNEDNFMSPLEQGVRSGLQAFTMVPQPTRKAVPCRLWFFLIVWRSGVYTHGVCCISSIGIALLPDF